MARRPKEPEKQDPGIAAALAWLDANWKHPIDREALVRGIVSAYNGNANAKP